MNLKRCESCKIEKALSLFGSDKRRNDGKHNRCKECKASSARRYYYSEKGKINRLSKYGISIQEFESLLQGQQNRCAICLKTMDVPCIDHDHITGRVRGLLCNECNRAIGILGDSADIVLRAYEYLKGSLPRND